MSVVFSDNFNRADNDSLGANWQAEVTEDTSLGDVDILTNRCRGVTKTTAQWVMVGTSTTGHAAIADCKVQVTQVQSGGDGGPIARLTNYDSTPTMYSLDAFSNTLETLRYNNSGASTTLQSSGVTSAANGVCALEVSGTGATVTLKAYYQGSQIGANISDTSGSRITAAGQTGLQFFNLGANGDYDDFSVDDLITAVVAAVAVVSYEQFPKPTMRQPLTPGTGRTN